MFRRSFIQRITAAGTVGITGAVSTHAAEMQMVAYHVKGFTCVTCAVGLEVMLREQKGVRRAKASYPEAKVVIGFDPDLTTEESIKGFINKTGFTVQADEGADHSRVEKS